MKLNASIRRAEPRDVERIVDFNIRMADETEGKRLDAKTVRQGVSTVINDSSKGFYLVAEDEGSSRVIGQLLVTFEWSDWRDKCFWWIQSVYVQPPLRRCGVFKRLYEFVDTLAAQRPDVCGIRLYVEQSNHTAKQTYANASMRETGYRIYEKLFQVDSRGIL